MATAKTQGEFAKAWMKEARHLVGFYPLDSDYEEFKTHIQAIKQLIVRKAQSLDLPVGDIDQSIKDAYEIEEMD